MSQDKIGIIAGEGWPPVYVARGARERGYHVTALAIKGITRDDIAEYVDAVHWIQLGRFNKMIKACKEEGLKRITMIGRIKQKLSLNPFNYDLRSVLLMMNLPDFRPKSIFRAIEEEMAREGIEILDTRPFLERHIPKAGLLTPNRPLTDEEEEAVRFGYPIAKWMADAEIGQSIIVDRKKAVIAVEAMEGTNKAIERVGELGIKDSITIKVSRSRQDFRFDIPTVGLTTLEKINDAGGSVLAITAGEVLFFQMEEALAFAEERDLCVIALPNEEYVQAPDDSPQGEN